MNREKITATNSIWDNIKQIPIVDIARWLGLNPVKNGALYFIKSPLKPENTASCVLKGSTWKDYSSADYGLMPNYGGALDLFIIVKYGNSARNDKKSQLQAAEEIYRWKNWAFNAQEIKKDSIGTINEKEKLALFEIVGVHFHTTLLDAFDNETNLNSGLLSDAVSYLKQRGISRELLIAYQVGFCDNSIKNETKLNSFSEEVKSVLFNDKGNSRNYKRITFPIKDAYGRVKMFVARKIDEEDSPYKYIYTQGEDKGKQFIGLSNVVKEIREKRTVTLLEGVMDVMSLSGSKFAAVGVGGSSLSEWQLSLLMILGVERVNLLFDNDDAGWKGMLEATKACYRCDLDVVISSGFLKKGEDIADWVKNGGDIDNIIPQNALSFWGQRWIANAGNSPFDRRKAKLDIKALIDNISCPIYRKECIEYLCTQISEINKDEIGYLNVADIVNIPDTAPLEEQLNLDGDNGSTNSKLENDDAVLDSVLSKYMAHNDQVMSKAHKQKEREEAREAERRNKEKERAQKQREREEAEHSRIKKKEDVRASILSGKFSHTDFTVSMSKDCRQTVAVFFDQVKLIAPFIITGKYRLPEYGTTNAAICVTIETDTGKEFDLKISIDYWKNNTVFNAFMMKHGLFFSGNSYELSQLYGIVARNLPVYTPIYRTGWDKSYKFWVWDNGIYCPQNREFFEIGECDSVQIGDNYFVLMRDENRAQGTYVYRDSNIRLKSYFPYLYKVYGEKAILMLSYILAAISADSIFNKGIYVPILACIGETQTGKSTFLDIMRSIVNADKVGLLGATVPGIEDYILGSQGSIVFLDEFQGARDEIEQMLKRMYGNEKRVIQGNRSNSLPNNALVIAGEVGFDAISAINRTIQPTFTPVEKNNAEIKSYLNVIMTDDSLTPILHELLNVRADIVSQFNGEYAEVIKDMRSQNLVNDNRILSSHAVMLAIGRLFGKLLNINFDIDKYTNYIYEICVKLKNKADSMSPIAKFWSALNDMHAGTGKGIEGLKFDLPKRQIKLKVTGLCHQLNNLAVYRQKPFNSLVILPLIKSAPYFVMIGTMNDGYVLNEGVKSFVKSHYCVVDMDKLMSAYPFIDFSMPVLYTEEPSEAKNSIKEYTVQYIKQLPIYSELDGDGYPIVNE